MHPKQVSEQRETEVLHAELTQLYHQMVREMQTIARADEEKAMELYLSLMTANYEAQAIIRKLGKGGFVEWKQDSTNRDLANWLIRGEDAIIMAQARIFRGEERVKASGLNIDKKRQLLGLMIAHDIVSTNIEQCVSATGPFDEADLAYVHDQEYGVTGEHVAYWVDRMECRA